MQLTARYWQTRRGLALKIEGSFDWEFHKKFLYHITPYAFFPVNEEVRKAHPEFNAYSDYLIDSKKDGRRIVDDISAKLVKEGHSIVLLDDSEKAPKA